MTARPNTDSSFSSLVEPLQNESSSWFDLSFAKAVPILKFLLAGLPAFILAIPLNFLLVDRFGIPTIVAYPIVLFFQVNTGFLLCRWKVFVPNGEKPVLRQYTEFLTAVAVFRVLDAFLYGFLVSSFPFRLVIAGRDCYYLVYQLANVVVFSLAKFVFCRRAIEGNRQ